MTASYRVVLTEPALADLEQIRDWLTAHGGADVADRFLIEVLDRVETLERFPERGSVPPALADLDETVRQMPVRPYRLIYDVGGDTVTIFAVLHERRNFAAALAERPQVAKSGTAGRE